MGAHDVPVERLTHRAKTINIRRLSKRELERGRLENPDVPVERPRVRGDCLPGGVNEARPCPFVCCKYHLYLDVNKNLGAIKMNFPDKEVWEVPFSCALDLAESGEVRDRESVARLMHLTKERIRQVEKVLFARLRMLEEARVALGSINTDDPEVWDGG